MISKDRGATLGMKALADDDRPYEKLEKQGAGALSDAELVAILLKTGVRGRNVVDVARTLLADERGLHTLRDASIEELRHFPGIGRVKSIILKAAVELANRLQRAAGPEPGLAISSPEAAMRHLGPVLYPLEREEFHILLLDTRRRLIRHTQVSAGGLSLAVVFPRDVFRHALRANAAFIILAHNHPSGDPTPSNDDIATTATLSRIGEVMGIGVTDHIVVGKTKYVSMKALGLMAKNEDMR